MSALGSPPKHNSSSTTSWPCQLTSDKLCNSFYLRATHGKQQHTDPPYKTPTIEQPPCQSVQAAVKCAQRTLRLYTVSMRDMSSSDQAGRVRACQQEPTHHKNKKRQTATTLN